MGLATYSDGFGSSPTDQLIANFSNHSLDMLFDLDTQAVSFLPVFVDVTGNPNTRGPVEVEVYDLSNNLVGTTVVNDVSFLLTDIEVGVLATGSTTIGRINLYDGSLVDWQGADDISVFRANSVPEPSTITILSLAIGTILVRRRSRAPIN